MKRWITLTFRFIQKSLPGCGAIFIFTLGAPAAVHATVPVSTSISTTSRHEKSVNFSDPVGLGTLYQRASGQTDFAFVVEDDHHFQQKRWVLPFAQYGFSQSRLEIGTASGIHLASVSGITLYGLGGHKWFAPQLGIEPFSARLSWNTSSVRESFYEWFPMLSAGPQLRLGSCRFLNVLRGGAAVGNIGRSGLLPRLNRAYGAGSHLDCSVLDIGADFTRMDGGISPIDLGTVDFSVHLYRPSLRFGVRMESIAFHGATAHQEQRAMLILRSQPF